MKPITRDMQLGALIWGIGDPFLLAFCNVRAYGISHFIGNFIFFFFSTGPLAILAGIAAGYFAGQWKQKYSNTLQILVSAAGVSAALNIFVEWASIGFLYSFGAVANHLSILGWIQAFQPIAIALLPLAVITGVLCGIMTALVVLKIKVK